MANEGLTREAITNFFVSWSIVAAALAVPLLWLRRHISGPILPPQRQRAVPWNLAHVGLLIAIYLLLDILFLAPFDRRDQLPIFPVLRASQAMAFVFGLRWLCGAQLYQMGLTFHRVANDIVAGCRFWFVVTPLVTAIYWAILWYERKGPHPIEEWLPDHPVVWQWGLVVVVAVVAAPLVEELFFRGIAQPLLVRSPQIANGVMLIAAAWVPVAWTLKALKEGITGIFWPLLFLAAAVPGYFLIEPLTRPWLPRPGAGRAIFVASLLFAAIHANVWPSPVPLFFLSLGLGFLAYRTQSLIGPIVAHGLFNAVSVIQLMGQKTGSF